MSNARTTLEEAIGNENLRQYYLNRIIIDSSICNGLVYDPDGLKKETTTKLWMQEAGYTESRIRQIIGNSFGDKGDYHAGIALMPSFMGVVSRMPLFVGRKFFDGNFLDGEIKHALQTHEFRHVQQQVDGFEYFDTEMFREDYLKDQIRNEVILCMAELDANTYSLQRLQGDGIRRSYVEQIVERCNLGFNSLTNAVIKGQLSPVEKKYSVALLDRVKP